MRSLGDIFQAVGEALRQGRGQLPPTECRVEKCMCAQSAVVKESAPGLRSGRGVEGVKEFPTRLAAKAEGYQQTAIGCCLPVRVRPRPAGFSKHSVHGSPGQACTQCWQPREDWILQQVNRAL